jgi:hypothetical protein
MHEADVAIRDHGLDLEFSPAGTHQQSLPGVIHAADGMDGELLHRSIHRRGKRLNLARCSPWPRPEQARTPLLAF